MSDKALRLDSILLGSRDPDRLADWYAAVFKASFRAEPIRPRIAEFGDVTILFEARDDVSDRNSEPGRHIFNFTVVDAAEEAKRLDALGVSWLAPLEERDVGWFGTLVDPDGNYVQIIEFKPAHLEG